MTSTSTFSEKSTAPEQPTGSTPSPSQVEINSLPERQPPLSDKCWLHGEKVGAGQVWVIVHQKALAQVDEHAHSNLGSELGGALVGKAYRYQKMVFVEVKAAIPVVTENRGPIHFTFSADSWPQIQRDRDTNYPDLDIVGWFHTHPGLGVFYSSDDVVVHSAAFTLPWHVGLVVDPVRKEASFFGWVDGLLTPLIGFYELLESEQVQSSVDWRVVPTQVWDDAQLYEEYPDALDGFSGERPYPHPQKAALTRKEATTLSNYAVFGLGAGLLGLFVVLALVFGWIWPLNQRVNTLEGMTLLLTDQSLVNTAVCPSSDLRILSPLTGSRAPVGSVITILGTAHHTDTNRFRLEQRLVNVGTSWNVIKEVRRDIQLGQLASWDTADLGAATYELRLTAVDRNNVKIENSPSCIIEIELTN
jgi:proteasome lid subunit RPN8/RPN11